MIRYLKGYKKKLGFLIFFIAGCVGVYLAGPAPAKPVFDNQLPVVPQDPMALEAWVNQNESTYTIKPDNEARIVWSNDSIKIKTRYSLVYLHGFSSSQEDGNPIHRWMAETYGMNLYLSRLADHGLVSANPLLNYRAEAAWQSAQEALAIGMVLGDSVILLSTSTGGTLSLMLCATYPAIAGQILLSPNIKLRDPSAWILNNHWGLPIAKKILGGDFRIVNDTTRLYSQYWNAKYRVESLTQLEELLESSMTTSLFKKILQPTLLLYYYKDAAHQDPVVSVDAMLEMFQLLGTGQAKKSKEAIPEAGDHGIGSRIKSRDLKSVNDAIQKFVDQSWAIRK